MKKHLLFASLLFSAGAYSQNSNSPYSVVGIGDIENNFYNRTSGLANTGVAYRNDRYMINNNPAAYTALQPQFFAIELSGRAQFISYFGTPVNVLKNSSKDLAIKRLAVGTKINKRWASGVGLAPFSTANYGFSSVKTIQGSSVNIPATYDGNGSINQVYWNNAVEITKHFSVGVQSSYLFGSLNQVENLYYSDLSTALTTTRQAFLRNFYFTYGAQFYHPVAKNWDISAGATYSNQTKLPAEYTVTVTDNTTQILSSQVVKDDYFKLPNSMGFGVALSHDKPGADRDRKYTWSADYKHQDWAATHYSGAGFSLQNSDRASIGFEAGNRIRLYNGSSIEKSYVQAGAYYGTSYLNINGEQINEMGVTFGYGFTAKRNPSLAGHLVLEIGQRGTEKNGLVKERFVNLGFTISYRDLWFTKGRKYN
ncbi:MAG TPA: hypothetical protein VLD19_01810 [Chitinophagaceae bacterium]|nr:hypothetical protein [Chitinophagaceae bacterium]